MLKKVHKSVGLLLALSFSTIAKVEPEFLEFYPECGFEIVDTVVHKGMIRNDSGKIGALRDNITKSATKRNASAETPQFLISQKLEKMHEDILADAADKDIKFIVVKDREIRTANDDAKRISVTVELLKTCDNPHKLGGKPAPFNALGEKLASFGNIQIGEKRTIVFDINRSNKRPDFGNDVEVSLASGLYGVPLGTNRDGIIEKFGAPSFWFTNSSGIEIIAYGRRHWLTLQDDHLVMAQFGDAMFSKELVNYFAFDERFDDRIWRLQQVTERDSVLSDDGKKSSINTPTYYDNDSVSLSVITEDLLENQLQERNRKVVGFELKQKDVKAPVFSQLQWANDQNQASLYDAVIAMNEFDDFAAEPLRNKALGRTSLENGKQYLLLDATTLIETKSNTVNKIFLSPDYIKGLHLQWKFGEFYAEQNIADVLEIAGSNAFYMNDVIEVEKGRYAMKMYTYEKDGETKLYSAEISIY